MEAASTSWRSLGEILLDRGLISPEDLERALAEEFATKRRLADVLVRRGLVTGHDITDALMEQLKHFGPEDGAGQPPLQPVDSGAVDQPEPHEGAAVEPHVEPPFEQPAAEASADLPVQDVAPDEPAEHAAPADDRPVLPLPPEDFVRQAEGRRMTAESHMSMLGGIGEGLERLRSELEAQALTTPPLVRELAATQERVRARKEALADEIAHLRRSREAVERISAELEQLRADLGGKLNDLSNLQATAALWNSRVEELESEVDAQVKRIDSLSRELASLVEGAPETPAMHAVTEVHEQPDAEVDVSTDSPVQPSSGETHLLFVPTNESYDLVEQAGPPPAVGESIDYAGATWVVTKVGPSPLPFDERACVFFNAS